MRRIVLTLAGAMLVVFGYALLAAGPERGARELFLRAFGGMAAVLAGNVLLTWGLLRRPLSRFISLFFEQKKEPEEKGAGAAGPAAFDKAVEVRSPPRRAAPARMSAVGLLLVRPTLLAAIDTEALAGRAEGPPSRVRYALVAGRRVLASGDCTSADLLGMSATQLRVAVQSRMSFFEQVELNVAKKQLLEASARRYVNTEQIFTDPYIIRCRTATETWPQVLTEIIAAPRADIELAMSALPTQLLPVTALHPAESAIAALVAQVTAEPVVVMWARGQVLINMLVVGGAVLTHHAEPLPKAIEDTGSEELATLVQRSAKAALAGARQKLGREVPDMLYLGELYGLAGQADSGAPLTAFAQDTARRLAALIADHGDEAAAGPAVLRHPELYGLLFADPVRSLLPPAYREEVQAYRLSLPAALAAGACAAVFALWGAVSLYRSAVLHEQFLARQAAVQQQAAQLEPRVPSPATVEALLASLRLTDKQRNELRVDRFLAWLSQATPAGVTLNTVSIKPAAAGRYIVHLEATIPGSYDGAKNLSFRFLKKLAEQVEPEINQFTYKPAVPPALGAGSFATKMTVAAARF